jgi:MFS family permease
MSDQKTQTTADIVVDQASATAPPHRHAAAELMDRRFVIAALMIVMVLASMEQTVTSTAMPTIIGELHGLEHYSWVASIYLLACTVSMPLYGRLADTLGRKRVIVAAITLFSVSSMLAAFSHSMGELILFRGLQGLGAGGIMPVVLTIQGDILTLQERAKLQALFSAVWGSAALGGPALGSLLVKTLGWRSIFYVNLPAGAVGLGILLWKYRDVEKPHSVDLDLIGAGTLAAACMALLLLLSGAGPDAGMWRYAWPAAMIAVFVIALTVFIWQERRESSPVLPLDFLTHRVIGPVLFGSFLLGAGFLSLDTFVPLYVQGGQGGGPGAAALVVTPVMLTWALSGIVAAPMVVKLGFRKTAMLGTSLVSVGFTGLLLCGIFELPPAAMIAVLLLTGLGFGPASMTYLLSAQESVTWQQRGAVTGSVSFFRTIGGALGIGALGGMFNLLMAPGLQSLRARNVTPAELLDPRLRSQIPEDVLKTLQHTISHSLLWVFAAMVLVALAGIAVTSRLPARKCDHAVSAAEALEAVG